MELMVTDPVEFRKLREILDLERAVLSSARMPGRVFRPGYGRFQFLEFDLFGSHWENNGIHLTAASAFIFSNT
jgi:hypothetical protein